MLAEGLSAMGVRHSQGGTETTGPVCGVIPPCPVQGSARPKFCLPWGWASPWGCRLAGASWLWQEASTSLGHMPWPCLVTSHVFPTAQFPETFSHQ